MAMRMRTTLLLCLLSVSFGVAALSLVAVHSILAKQIRSDIAADLQHSILTFQNIQVQRRRMLLREAALLADLPVLKSLMTTDDGRTIRDGAAELYDLSGDDLFALTDRSGNLMALFQNGTSWNGSRDPAVPIGAAFVSLDPHYVLIHDRLYETVSQPLYFGSPSNGTSLGYVAIGYEINDLVAQEVSQAAAAEVVFSVNGAVVAATRNLKTLEKRVDLAQALFHGSTSGDDVWLGREHYVRASIKLSQSGDPLVELVVLKSYDQASVYLTRLNRVLVALGALILLVSGVLALYISRTITLPLEALVAGARSVGSGNFDYHFQIAGAKELQELGTAFERMSKRLQKTQQELLDAERLATIGRMASSISHDLRHFLSAVYANAEFLGYDSTRPAERAGLFAEVRLGVQGMTELIDSLLLFSQTGQSVQLTYESLPFVVERALALVRTHPDAHNVIFFFNPLPQIEAWIDALKIERAIYNLLLNGCQAAKLATGPAKIHVALSETPDHIKLSITDNGPGVPDSIRVTLFQPFVSEGKLRGVGLGLTLANKIAQEHGGSVVLEESNPGKTVFSLRLEKAALKEPEEYAQHTGTLVSND